MGRRTVGRLLFSTLNSDSDSDHMLQSQLSQRIYATCDMKHGMRALLQGGALASRDVMPSLRKSLFRGGRKEGHHNAVSGTAETRPTVPTEIAFRAVHMPIWI